ncbi:hypothetical protein INT44_006851 [Umbelopsis vinacea]|uniref:Uncharacterized protein n=1 Tax=Umbelopsis vinacea TaxID=44442 RepID=A0A8H7PII6_9FUNG|nr:hypothetical protein INT44_006851 [Umbelopsis vinacea]
MTPYPFSCERYPLRAEVIFSDKPPATATENEVRGKEHSTYLVELVAKVDRVDVITFQVGEHNDLSNRCKVKDYTR